VHAKNNGTGKGTLHYQNSGDAVRLFVEYPGGVSGSSVNGDINISGRNGSVSISGGHVIINGILQSALGLGSPVNAAQVDLIIEIPRLLLNDLAVDVGQGDIEMAGYFANGPATPRRSVELKTSQGEVTCDRVCALGRIKVKSSQGDVDLTRMIGPLEAKSSQGEVRLTKSLGDSEIKSSQGEVKAESNVGNIDAKSSMGNVKVTGQTRGGVDARTSMGDIKLNNPGAAFEKTKASMGSVRATAGIPNQKRSTEPVIRATDCADDLIRTVEAL
jgi:DUF4097 and DUF4098 domain-containing protein YvlB